jgi:mono/diheme cytochrome c family protein
MKALLKVQGLWKNLLWMSGITVATNSVWAESSPRIEAARAAAAALSEINFFADGRGMHISPNLVGVQNVGVIASPEVNSFRNKFEKIARDRWGLLSDGNGLAGFSVADYKGMRVGVMGCAVCHSGRAAGRFIHGLGNKNIDVHKLAQDVQRVEKIWKRVGRAERDKDDDYRIVEDSALDMASYIYDPRVGSLTQGLVPISLIEKWFYRQAGLPNSLIVNRGQVKVPALWGYGKKREVGQFCDGFGNGVEPGWAVAVELASGQTPEVVRSYMPKVAEAEKALEALLPPAYPFAIDHRQARLGQGIFEASCARCHGSYENDQDGLPIYEAPHFVPITVVGTDDDRLKGPNSDFKALVAENSLNDIIRYNDRPKGYFAPRLNGIWARFPYLHNGSVPSLWDLLTAPAERPLVFDLRDAGEDKRFDRSRGGLTTPRPGTRSWNILKAKASANDRSVYDTRRVGHSNQGHNFQTQLDTQEKRALLEYLKTL